MISPSDHSPPGWIRKLLALFLEPRRLEAALGDLEEKFRMRLNTNTPLWKSRLFYVIEGLGFFKMASRQKNASVQTTINMIGHTLLFFSRLVSKDKSYYLVSLLGLTVSLSSFLFIMMFITDELSYDKFHEKSDRIYRITTHLRLGDVAYHEATSQFPAARAFQSEFAAVEEAVRIYPGDLIFESGDKKFQEHTIFADENFFKVFSFRLVYGDTATAFDKPSNIILTQSTTKKYFGTDNPIGKIILAEGQTLIVSGVLQDVPEQSHIKFDAIIPMSLKLAQWKSETGTEGRENKWFWTGAYTYLLLKNKVDIATLRTKMPLIINKYFPARYKDTGLFELQPITDIHLKSNLDAELEPGGNILYVRLFSIVAVVIMLVSTINLINLSYFKISSRIREVGIRKFLGQNAARIIAQLSIESILVGILAFLFAVVLCQISLSNFNLLVQKNLRLWSTSNMMLTGATLLMIVLICLTSVIRPAIRYATRSSSYLLLHNAGNTGRARLRNTLIGLQVCFSFVLLVFSFIISSQIDFFRNKDLGFDKKNVVVLNLNPDFYENFETFKDELKQSQHVVEVSGADVPGLGYSVWRFVPEGGSHEKPLMLPFTSVDYSFLNAMNIKLVAGENFDPKNNYDSLMPFLINRRAALELGWQDDPLGRKLEVFAPGTTEIMAKGKVIGLVEDYHFESLHKSIKPVVITVGPYFSSALIRVSGTLNEGAIAAIGEKWKMFSTRPFEYEVLDKTLEKLYVNETKLSNLILFFTFIALYLTCYGLFAMSSLLFSSKLKEVAIRKVFGADQFTIVKQLYSRYAVFNLVAIVVGLPIAIWLGELWLQTFQFRITLTSSFFLKAAFCILLAGLLSVSYYLVRVSFSNPVRFLRRE